MTNTSGIDVDFVGLYDPVDMAETIPGDESMEIAANIKRVAIVGPVAGAGNVDYDSGFLTPPREPIFIRMANGGRLTQASPQTMVARFSLNASHGSIGGTPGFHAMH